MIKLEKEIRSLLSRWHKQLSVYKKDWVGKEISRDVRHQIARDLGVSYVTFYDNNGNSDYCDEYQEPMVITSNWNIVTEDQDLNYHSNLDEVYLDIKVKRKPKEKANDKI